MYNKVLMFLVAGIFVLGISKLSFAMMCGEHSGHKKIAQTETETGTQTQAEADTQALPKETVNAGNKICPVSGEKIDEATRATYKYEGKIYNFCCPMCIDEFKKDPEKYIKKIEQELQVESKEQAEHKEHEMEMIQGSETMNQGMHQDHH